MKEQYKAFTFRKDSLDLIYIMNTVIRDWMSQGFTLTVRQLYYQLVAGGHIENTERSYKRVTGLVNDARLDGLIDWDAIEDRTREFVTRSRWSSGSQILRGVAEGYHMDMWDNQDSRVFVIVEKEALAGILEQACYKWDVPLLAARGYPSGTVLREFAEDVLIPAAVDCGQDVVILHFGDHDPSGIDMSRDLEERLMMFTRNEPFEFRRIALNMDQIEELNPPPNPAKSTDSRFLEYRRKFGTKSWELDALRPAYLTELVDSNVQALINEVGWEEQKQIIDNIKTRLNDIVNDFDEG